MKSSLKFVVAAVIVIIISTSVFFAQKYFFSTKKPQLPKESKSGQQLPPTPGEETDVSHNVYRMTDEVTFSPYASQTLFRGDVVSWDETTVTIDVKSDRVAIQIPDRIYLYCRTTYYPNTKTKVADQNIIWFAKDRNVGTLVDRSLITTLFPQGSANMIVAADVSTTGEKTAYLITHIGCADPDYPVKIP